MFKKIFKFNYSKEINNYFKQHKIDYKDQNNILDKQMIYNLLFNDIIPQEQNTHIYNLLGLYYNIKKDYPNMLKYYLMAIKNNNIDAIFNLGNYYYDTQDYPNMLKYYLIAVKYDDDCAMNNLAIYYEEQKDYPNMLKYYLMSISKGNTDAIINLNGCYDLIKNSDL
jgi:TPR repeat protein